MPSDDLLSPVSAGRDRAVSDAAVLDALVTAEVALLRARSTLGTTWGADIAGHAAQVFGWQGAAEGCRDHGITADAIAAAAVLDGNPVIPLVAAMRERMAFGSERLHEGATSQDILDSALMRVAARASAEILESLARTETALAAFAREHRDEVAAARTLTQLAVPTTVGLRAANWLRGIQHARVRLAGAADAVPAQLGGAAGTLASFVELCGADAAAGLPAVFAAELGLAAPDAPWHTSRWPVTELGDALTQVVDALGKLAGDVATLSRTEIGELSESAGGGSSAMPQKRNPVESVLIRSAAIRAPQLNATLHLAAALAVDERPDGAWHAEWPALRELLRIALGASAHAASLVEGLRVDHDAVARNLAAGGGLVVAERWRYSLTRYLSPADVEGVVAGAARGEDLGLLLEAAIQRGIGQDPRAPYPEGGVASQLDPARYTGLAGLLTDAALADWRTTQADAAESAAAGARTASLPELRPAEDDA